MRSSFLGLEVSKRTIQLAQKSLDITGNNLSNVNTEGYTRQRVDVSSLYLSKYANWQTRTSRMSLAGQGTTAYGVNQIRDQYIDKRYRESACYVAQYSTTDSVLKEIATTLDNIVSDGLPAYMDTFSDALKKYAEQPDSEELGSIVRNEAYNITNLLHSYQTDLEELKESNLEALGNTIDETNRVIRDIVDFNKKIVKEYSIMATGKLSEGESVTGGYGPNEMLDARNLLLDELAYYGNITVYDNADGSVRVLMDGIEIIDGETYEQIYMRSSTKNVDQEEYTSEILRDYHAYEAVVLRWTSGDPAEPSSGELRSYIDVLNGNGVYNTGYQNDAYGIPYYESTIDAFANDFATMLNTLNGALDEKGNVINPERLLLVTDNYNEGLEEYGEHYIEADTIRIANSWMENATMIGEVYDPNSDRWTLTQDGNHINEIVVKINSGVIAFGGKGDYEGTIYDYLLFISNRLSQDIDYNKAQYDSAYDTTNALLDSRDAVSGVSSDEEGINMLTYQNWYSATSRMMTALDDALDKLINSTGRVGL
ncbi:MAG: flagellar hook-associated protein FlgK [Ruminiclostridium sp.]|nr:flagellar hook-associated protein FlgK [Ruminiclostridium sp.]